MASTAIFPDVELAITGLLRPRLAAAHDVLVTNRQVATTRRYTVVVRDDGGPSRLITSAHRVGIRVLGPDGDWQGTGDLARLVTAHMRLLPGAGPVVDVSNLSEPYRVEPSAARPEFYLTGEVTVVGQAFTPNTPMIHATTTITQKGSPA